VTPPSHPTLFDQLRVIAGDRGTYLPPLDPRVIEALIAAADEIERLDVLHHKRTKLEQILIEKKEAAEARVVSLEARVEKLRVALDTYAQYREEAVLDFVSGALAKKALTEDDAAKETP
jgi:hypothetical protein